MKKSQSRNIKSLLFGFLTVLFVAGGVKADFFFGEPQNMGQAINSPYSDYSACISTDGLELYFCSERPGGFGAGDIWVSTRKSTNDPWDPPSNLGSTVNSSYNESYPSLSSDGLTLYFSDAYTGSPRPGGLGGGDIWMTTRPSRDASWSEPVNVGAPINSSNLDMSPTISGDGLTLVFTSNNRARGTGSWDLWMSTRISVQDPWGLPVNLGTAVNSGAWDGECGLSWDGLVVLYDSGRTGIFGAIDMFMSIRKTLADPWFTAFNLGPVINSSSNDGTPRVSADMKTLYFCSNRPGGFGSYDLFEAPIIPILDFNGDGIVEIGDLLFLIESWGQDDSTTDIGPAPWGDGIVDVQDLEVLMSYWGQEVEDPTLAAHWKLDEAEGSIAEDSAGDNNGIVFGDAVWQPDGGMIKGALQFDGIDDYVSTPFVLNPADGSFSVFAWIKGGTPGQVILSQLNGANWLGADPDLGCVMTELIPPAAGRFVPQPLISESVITDGNWHRVGFVRDGINRILYVDDVEVARDTATSLEAGSGGLYIGAGSRLEPGTFWSGLIDDVRIYNRVVSP
jgi:hypothetical protein